MYCFQARIRETLLTQFVLGSTEYVAWGDHLPMQRTLCSRSFLHSTADVTSAVECKKDLQELVAERDVVDE